MLTRANLKAGGGELEPFNPEIRRANRRKRMEDGDSHSEHDKYFIKGFY